MTAWGSCTLTHFDRQFLFFSGSLKKLLYLRITYRLANIFYTTMTHNIVDLVEFNVKCPVIACTQTAHGNMSRGKKCIKETSSDWPT